GGIDFRRQRQELVSRRLGARDGGQGGFGTAPRKGGRGGRNEREAPGSDGAGDAGRLLDRGREEPGARHRQAEGQQQASRRDQRGAAAKEGGDLPPLRTGLRGERQNGRPARRLGGHGLEVVEHVPHQVGEFAQFGQFVEGLFHRGALLRGDVAGQVASQG